MPLTETSLRINMRRGREVAIAVPAMEPQSPGRSEARGGRNKRESGSSAYPAGGARTGGQESAKVLPKSTESASFLSRPRVPGLPPARGAPEMRVPTSLWALSGAAAKPSGEPEKQRGRTPLLRSPLPSLQPLGSWAWPRGQAEKKFPGPGAWQSTRGRWLRSDRPVCIPHAACSSPAPSCPLVLGLNF